MELGQVTGPVVLQLLKILTTVRTVLYGVGWQVMGPVVPTYWKTLTTFHALAHGMGAGDGTVSTTIFENINHCPYSGLWSWDWQVMDM
jgi:hypothetical protein